MNYSILASDGGARTGLLRCEHGEIATPAFMPVGTVGSVKGIEARELEQLGAQVCLSNAYHLYLRPGTEIVDGFGGLHRFMAWPRPILIDSGGFQVFSLAPLREVEEEGVRFRSHIDGGEHLFTPESVVDIQRALGPDFVMPLDELVGWPAERSAADAAAERTWRWLERALEHFEKQPPRHGYQQTLLPIIQGSFYRDLRERETARILGLRPEMVAIGGLAVGEQGEMTRQTVEWVTAVLPESIPRYAMGIGTPVDMLDAVARGVDLFDCVVPTRNGRNATLFTMQGRINMRNASWKDDPRPVEEGCPCPLCTQYSRAYLRHLYHAGEILALKLGTAHNLSFYFRLLSTAREQIAAGTFTDWYTNLRPILPRLQQR